MLVLVTAGLVDRVRDLGHQCGRPLAELHSPRCEGGLPVLPGVLLVDGAFVAVRL
jgi:hypothetical protein